jgi:hypothetical protein
MSDRGCSHLDAIDSIKQPQRRECEECVKVGAYWVHLHICQTRGATLCCDSSPNRHASKHAHATGRLKRFHKCCSHRPVAGPPRRCSFTLGTRPTGPWLQRPLHSKLRTQNAACPSIFPYVCCSINFRICGAGIAPAWRATSRPLRNKAIVGIAVIRKRAARLGTSSVFTFARTN